MTQEELNKAHKHLKITREIGISDGVQVKLEKIKWVLWAELRAVDIDAMVEVGAMVAWAHDTFVIRAVGHVWGETLDKRTIRHPLNWIEAIKERWAPWWYKAWSPVRYKVHHVEAKAYYPGLAPSLPDEPWRIVAYMGSEEERAGD